MQQRRFLRLWLVLALLVGTGTIAASAPAACAGAHCIYLPMVSTPVLVKLSDVSLGRTRFEGYTNISGEVQLTTNTPVYSVTLEVRSYDEQGNVITTGTGYPVFPATLPRQPNPFFFGTGFPPDSEPVPAYDIHVKSLSRAHPRTFRAPTLDVTVERCAGSDLQVEGTLTNANPEPLEDVKGIMWGQQRPYGLFPQQFATRLEPFQTVPFSASITYEGCGVFGPPTYQIAAQGVVP